MTLLERDILAVLLSLNTVFMILILPNIIPIAYDLGQPTVYLTTLAWGLPLGAIGVWVNHRVYSSERKKG
jgi:hypothetical protein